MFNLGHNYMNIVTVTDEYRSGYNETLIKGYTTVSFMEGEVTSHPSPISSAL
jgi:hypothetical protein